MAPLDIVVQIAGKSDVLWRPVEHEHSALARHPRRAAADAQAARVNKLRAEMLVTDKLRSYSSAFRRRRLTCRHEQGSGGTPIQTLSW
jgi:transposase-like protein